MDRLTYDMPSPNWKLTVDYSCPECGWIELMKATNMGVLGVGTMFHCLNCNYMGILANYKTENK